MSRAQLHPETGRKHQLRLHMACAGTPILGDPRYAPALSRAEELGGALHLYALALEIPHPATGEPLRLRAPTPGAFGDRLDLEEAAADALPAGEWEGRVAQMEAKRLALLRSRSREARAEAGGSDPLAPQRV